MRVLTVVHEADAGPGVFADAAARLGAELVEWSPGEVDRPSDALEGYDAVLVLGGSMHPDQAREYPWLTGEKRLLGELIERSTPMLGVCLGAELLAEVTGGAVERLPAPEIGWLDVTLTEEGRSDPVLGVLPEHFSSLHWHSYACVPPSGATDLGTTGSGVDAFRVGDAWGVQFHPEVTVEIVQGWLDHHREDSDAVAAGFDPEPVRATTVAHAEGSREVGEALFAGFLQRAVR